jgi:hypothetical protein
MKRTILSKKMFMSLPAGANVESNILSHHDGGEVGSIFRVQNLSPDPATRQMLWKIAVSAKADQRLCVIR